MIYIIHRSIGQTSKFKIITHSTVFMWTDGSQTTMLNCTDDGVVPKSVAMP